MIKKRASETSVVEEIDLTVNVARLAQETTKREKIDREEYQRKYEHVFAKYNKIQQKNIELETTVQRLHQKQLEDPLDFPSTSKTHPTTPTKSASKSLVGIGPSVSTLEPIIEEPTYSVDPTKAQMLEKIKELELQIKDIEERAVLEKKAIVNTVLSHLNEKIDSRLHSFIILFIV